MKKIILMSLFIVFSFAIFAQDKKTIEFVEQTKKEISRLKQYRNQETDEMKKHQKSIKIMDTQIKDREKTLKLIKKTQKSDKKQ